MGVSGQGSNLLRGAPEERLGQENGLLGAGPQGTGSALLPKKRTSQIQKVPPPQKKKMKGLGPSPRASGIPGPEPTALGMAAWAEDLSAFFFCCLFCFMQ